MASDITPLTKSREKVQLKPGHHLVDWVRLNNTLTMPASSKNRSITAEELALHNTKTDCWTAYEGKVYNITNYLLYHPGGEAKLMLGAGIDCTQLFNKYHRWVNGHAMLSNCYMGKYVEQSSESVTKVNTNSDKNETESSANTHFDSNDNTLKQSSFSTISNDGISLNDEIVHKAISELELSDDSS